MGLPATSVSSQAFVAIGDYNGHVGLGVKCSKEVATAIRGAIILAKLSIVPVRRGYWGNKIGKPHTVPCKVGWVVVTDGVFGRRVRPCLLTPTLSGDWPLWLRAGAPHPCPQGYGHCLGPCAQEVADDGWD